MVKRSNQEKHTYPSSDYSTYKILRGWHVPFLNSGPYKVGSHPDTSGNDTIECFTYYVGSNYICEI